MAIDLDSPLVRMISLAPDPESVARAVVAAHDAEYRMIRSVGPDYRAYPGSIAASAVGPVHQHLAVRAHRRRVEAEKRTAAAKAALDSIEEP